MAPSLFGPIRGILIYNPHYNSDADADPTQQVLWTHAQNIADSYPENQRDQYRTAALTMRLPFWDWVVNPALPDVTTQPRIIVNTPSGPQTINNPLYQYTFQAGAAGNGFPQSDSPNSVCYLYIYLL